MYKDGARQDACAMVNVQGGGEHACCAGLSARCLRQLVSTFRPSAFTFNAPPLAAFSIQQFVLPPLASDPTVALSGSSRGPTKPKRA